ncbi:hypothetical protein [Raoultella planticola]
MAELERTKIIVLTTPLEDVAQKTRYEQLELKAPTLSQVPTGTRRFIGMR